MMNIEERPQDRNNRSKQFRSVYFGFKIESKSMGIILFIEVAPQV